MNRPLILIAAMCLVFVCAASMVMADDVSWTTTFSTLSAQTKDHNDLEPFKGSAMVTVLNDTDEYWTDFHFEVFSIGGSNISHTIFVDGTGLTPSSSQSGLTWHIDNNPAGAKMDLYFAGDRVAPGATAWFKVYTDNTTNKQRFGLLLYPTTDTVPEPGSLFAFASGLIGFAGFALRKRH